MHLKMEINSLIFSHYHYYTVKLISSDFLPQPPPEATVWTQFFNTKNENKQGVVFWLKIANINDVPPHNATRD